MPDDEADQNGESLQERFATLPVLSDAIGVMWNLRIALENENAEEEGALVAERDRQLQAIALIETSFGTMDPWLATNGLAERFINAVNQVNGHLAQFRLTQAFPTSLVDFARDNLYLAGTSSLLPALGDAESRHAEAVTELQERTAEATATTELIKDVLQGANQTIDTRLGAEGSETSRLLADASARIDQAIASGERQFELQRDTAQQQHEDERKSIVQYGEEVVRQGDEVLTELRKRLAIAGDESLSAAYGNRADEEDTAANWMRKLALVFGVIAAIVTGAEVLVQLLDDSAKTSWALVPVKLAGALVLGGIAAYCGRESSRHRQFGQQLRIAQLELHNIGPYLAELDPPRRADVKERLVETFFGKSLTTAEPDGPTAAASADQLLEILRLIFANK